VVAIFEVAMVTNKRALIASNLYPTPCSSLHFRVNVLFTLFAVCSGGGGLSQPNREYFGSEYVSLVMSRMVTGGDPGSGKLGVSPRGDRVLKRCATDPEEMSKVIRILKMIVITDTSWWQYH
jgi:hypothetical protein